MKDSMLKQIADLQNLSHEELRELWKTLYGGYPPAYNRRFVISRLAYRIQELAYGGLSDEAKERMNDVLRTNGFHDNACDSRARRTRREKKRKLDLPVVGTRLIRDWTGRRYEVIVVHNGFEFEERVYRSLTAVAKAITGTHQSGRAFFGLQNRQTRNVRAGR